MGREGISRYKENVWLFQSKRYELHFFSFSELQKFDVLFFFCMFQIYELFYSHEKKNNIDETATYSI